ncbi:PilZ domain-containing protein [Sneathiella aquimaris]|uniref:PilZ domain-containing protein n=1 Tax=Sneathiella aquimaris TaxID=2599305 RepID=UPI00146DE36F|nr:PilZ domain-containing protein [Sneathiella aquimaris]
MNDIPDDENRRLYHRNTAPRVVVIIAEKAYLAKDWSPAGFCIENTEGSYSVGEDISGEIDIFGVNGKGQFTGTVVRNTPSPEIAVKFEHLSAHSHLALCTRIFLEDRDFDTTI